MTISILLDEPREWASDTNFSGGDDVGTPTKVDPGAALAAQGLVPGEPLAGQHVNHTLNSLSVIQAQLVGEARRNLTNRSRLRLMTSLTLGDTANSLGVVNGLFASDPILVIKVGTNDCLHLRDWDLIDPAGSVTSITSNVCGVARGNGAVVVAIGTGGNRCCRTLDHGDTWSAGSDLGATPEAIVYNATHTRFMVTFAAGVNVAQDVDGASTWASVSTGLNSAQGGLAVLDDGTTVACGLDASSDVDFSISANGGVSWSTALGTVPNPDSYDDSGWICGNGGEYVWHVGRSTADLKICRSGDGATWDLLTTLTVPTGFLPNAKPRILCCQVTGLLAVVCELTNDCTVAYTSTDGGLTWSSPLSYGATGAPPATAFGVAGGRVICSFGANLLASDGIGRE